MTHDSPNISVMITSLNQTFGESQFIMAQLVRIVSENLSSQASYKEVVNFFEMNDPGAGQPVSFTRAPFL